MDSLGWALLRLHGGEQLQQVAVAPHAVAADGATVGGSNGQLALHELQLVVQPGPGLAACRGHMQAYIRCTVTWCWGW